MIKQIVEEHKEGDHVVRTIKITFLGIPIFNYRKTTTNIVVIRQFTEIKTTKVKGLK